MSKQGSKSQLFFSSGLFRDRGLSTSKRLQMFDQSEFCLTKIGKNLLLRQPIPGGPEVSGMAQKALQKINHKTITRAIAGLFSRSPLVLCHLFLDVPPPKVQSALYLAVWDFRVPTQCFQPSMVAAFHSSWTLTLVKVRAPSSSASTGGSSSVERGSIYCKLMACCRWKLLVEGWWMVVECEIDLASMARRFFW